MVGIGVSGGPPAAIAVAVLRPGFYHPNFYLEITFGSFGVFQIFIDSYVEAAGYGGFVIRVRADGERLRGFAIAEASY